MRPELQQVEDEISNKGDEAEAVPLDQTPGSCLPEVELTLRSDLSNNTVDTSFGSLVDPDSGARTKRSRKGAPTDIMLVQSCHEYYSNSRRIF